jgi:hypothetical protein
MEKELMLENVSFTYNESTDSLDILIPNGENIEDYYRRWRTRSAG